MAEYVEAYELAHRLDQYENPQEVSVTRGCHTQIHSAGSAFFAAVQCAGSVRGPDDGIADFRWELWHAPLYHVTDTETRRIEQGDPVTAGGPTADDESAIAAHLANFSEQERTVRLDVDPADGDTSSTEQRLEPERGRTVWQVAPFADSVEVGVTVDGSTQVDRSLALTDEDRVAAFVDPDGSASVTTLQPAELSDFD